MERRGVVECELERALWKVRCCGSSGGARFEVVWDGDEDLVGSHVWI